MTKKTMLLFHISQRARTTLNRMFDSGPLRRTKELNGPAGTRAVLPVGLPLMLEATSSIEVAMLGLLLGLGFVWGVFPSRLRGLYSLCQSVNRDLPEWLHALGPTSRPISFGVFAARGPRDPRQRARSGGRSVFTSPVNERQQRARTGRITVAQSGRATEEYSVTLGQTVILGRATDADVVINDPQVSRRHLEIQLTPRGWLVRDLGATNTAEVDRGSGFAPLGVEEQLVRGRLRVGSSLLVLHALGQPVGFGSARPFALDRRRLAALGAAMVGVIGVLVAVVLAIRLSGDDEPSTGDLVDSRGYLRAVVGTPIAAVPYSESWQPVTGPRGVSFRLPPTWTYEPIDGESIALLPSGSPRDGRSAVITLSVVPVVISRQSIDLDTYTPPATIQVAGNSAFWYENRLASIPHEVQTIVVPRRNDSITIETPFGPNVDLRPQLDELLKGLMIE